MYRLSVYKNCETDQSQIENQTDCRTVFQVGRSGGWVGISIFIVTFKVALQLINLVLGVTVSPHIKHVLNMGGPGG